MIWSRIIPWITQKKSITSMYHSEIQKSCSTRRILERYEEWRSKIVFNATHALKISKTGRDICTSGSVLQGFTAEVKKQAERRINSRFLMHDTGVQKILLKNSRRGRRYGNSAESQTLKRARGFMGSARRLIEIRNDRGAARIRILVIRHGRIWQNRKWKKELRTFSHRTGLLPRPIQGRTTQSRRRQQQREDKRTRWMQANCTVEMGTHDHTIFTNHCYRGHHGHRGHGDNPKNLPHLMSQQLILNTNWRAPAQATCFETTQIVNIEF